MTPADVLDDLIQELDSLRVEQPESIEGHQDEVWNMVVGRSEMLQALFHRRTRKVGLGATAVVAVVAALTLALVPTGRTPSAAAAMLNAAATADAPAAQLPTLAAGQYYYQRISVSMVCNFSATGMTQTVNYVEEGVVQSWTNSSGAGRVVVTPSRAGSDGSHFATVADRDEWIAAGRPFIPCALGTSSNAIINNQVNSDPDSSRHFEEEVSEYYGFGSEMGSISRSEMVAAASKINQLPGSPAVTESMLANGEVSTMATTTTVPSSCPYGPPSESTGCSSAQQLAILQDLLQLPDASSKLGSVLYQIAAENPMATVTESSDPVTGHMDEAVTVSSGLNQQFEITIDSVTGQLLSCSAMAGDRDYPQAQLTFSPVVRVSGMGRSPRF